MTAIIGPPSAHIGQAHKWADNKRANTVFHTIIDAIYIKAPIVGVDPAVAVAQSAKETGYAHFGGVLDASYHNTAGMKTTEGGGNFDPAAHQRFPNWDAGALAHCAHLALYAGHITAERAKELGDPRAFAWIHGVAPTVEQLEGRWATDPNYADDVIRRLTEMRNTVAEPLPPPKPPSPPPDVPIENSERYWGVVLL